MADKRVLFTNVPNLVIELKEAMSKNEITYYKKRFERYELVIIDELGYVSFDKQGNEILFCQIIADTPGLLSSQYLTRQVYAAPLSWLVV